VNRRLTPADRLRIERVLWTVDFLIHDIRTRGRRTIRRDLRSNLQAAAREAGVGEAIRQLGPIRRLARGYLDAEYGPEARRPRWMAAIGWMFVCTLFIEALTLAGLAAYVQGVGAGNPAAHGTYVWNQLAGMGLGRFTVTFSHGQVASLQGVLPWTGLLYLATALILGGRLWRLAPRRRA
jgi:hypothetical protein